MKQIVLFLSSLLILATACSKDEAPVLVISQTEFSAPSNGCSTTIKLTANNPWSVSGMDWCTVSPSRGEGTGEVPITITVKENTTYDARNCTLTFSSLNLSQSLSVNQGSNFGIVLPKNTFEISSDTQQISVEVKANVDYEVNISADWIKLSGTKALSSKTYIFDIEKNNTYDTREGIINIKEKNSDSSETIKIKQVQLDAILISSKEHNLSSEAQSLEIKLQTNVDLEVVIPDNSKDWITHTATKALSDKTLVLDIKANDTYDARSSEIIIKKKNSTLADTLKIRQAQKDAIIISQKEYKLSKNAHTIEIKIQTNIDWEIFISKESQGWISLIETKGLTNNTLIFGIMANNTYESREGEIFIKNEKKSIIDTIKIAQAQIDTLILATKKYHLSGDNHSLKVEMKSNTDLEIVIPEEAKTWVSLVETKAIIDKTIILNISKNNSDSERKTDIYIFGKTASLKDTISIYQNILQPKNQIWYTSLNETIVNPNNSSFGGALITSNTYKNGKGIITFDKSITTIGIDAFWKCDNLISAILPDGITSIDYYAFANCTNLTSISIPYSVTNIGEQAFARCYNLKDITIPQGVLSLGKNAFSECNSLESVSLPESLTTILEGAFSKCRSLKKIFIPNSVSEIGSSAFMDCSSLTDITLSNSMTSISDGLFYGCERLNNVNIPESVISLGSIAFKGCSSLSLITIPEAVMYIGDSNPFEKCYNLTFAGKYASSDGRCLIKDHKLVAYCAGENNVKEYEVPSGVKSIGCAAFAYCANLKSISIPEGVTSLMNSAFYGCSYLESVNLPESLITIETSVFADCQSLMSIVIPSKVSRISGYAFYGCDNLRNVVIHGKIPSVENSTFYGCINLKNITLPESVTSIGRYAFYKCNNLTDFTIPEKVKSIGSYAFYYCQNLRNIAIPKGVSIIEKYTFCGCWGLLSITIPANVTSIEENGFSENFSAEEVLCFATTPPECSYGMYFNKAKTVLKVPKGCVELYKNNQSWNYGFLNIVEME